MNRIVAFLITLIISFPSFGESISREALFQRAFDSMGFILRVLVNDKNFIKELNEKEKEILKYSQVLVEKVTTYNWLKKNNNSYNRSKDDIIFYYVTSKNQIRELRFSNDFGFDLKFSNQNSEFDLKDGSAIRDAVTTNLLNDDILINQNRINEKSRLITLGDAFSLVLHEFGHKLNMSNDQDDIDSLASKIKKFVDQNTQIHQLKNGRLSVFKLLRAPFDPWAEAIGYGIYQGVNIPFQFSDFTYQNNQGVWVLFENTKSVSDITNQVFQKTDSVIKYNADARYDWVEMNWFMTDEIQVFEKDPNQIQLDLNLNHLQFVVPFLKPISPHPSEVGLYENLFQMQSFAGDFVSKSVILAGSESNLKVKSQHSIPFRFQDPSFEIKLISQNWIAEDLIFKFYISGKHLNPIEENQKVELRPVLILSLDGSKFEIASLSDARNTEHIFNLSKIKKLGKGKLKVESLELRPAVYDLSKMAADFRVKLFIPKINSIELSGEKGNVPRLLNQKIEGTKLKLEFQSSETVRSIQLLQNYELTSQVSSVLFPGRPEEKKITGPLITQSKSMWFEFNSDQMIQKIEKDHLFVEVDLNHNAKLKDSMTYPIHAGAFLASHETHSRFVNDKRFVESIKVVTQDYRAIDFDLPKSSALSCRQVVR